MTRRFRLHVRRRDERGYVAIMVALLLIPIIGLAGLAVDAGQWYVTARDAQRAADAGALAGVPYLPTDPTAAFNTAVDYAGDNGFADSDPDVSVETNLADGPTKLQVSVSKTVPSIFGGIFGIASSTITRSAVADYAGPVPLGSPCNQFGNDPEPGKASSVCDDVGQFWANVGSPAATKASGDAYQDNNCSGKPDNCTTSSGPNVDYDTNGYFYSITLTRAVNNLVIEAFDPALIHVGNLCDSGTGTLRKTVTSGTTKTTYYAKNLGSKAVVSNPETRYAEGERNASCTGDVAYANTSSGYDKQVATSFTVRDPGSNPWDPTSFPERSGCSGTGVYPGYAGNLVAVLDKTEAAYNLVRSPALPGSVSAATTSGYVASVFRQWVPLCTITHAEAGTYLVQVKTNGLGADDGNGHNRYALRAYSSSDPSAKDVIAISGYNKMTVYANLPDAETTFYLARVPSGAGGQLLKVQLYDVGDSTAAGTIRVLAPEESGLTFSNCIGSGVQTGTLVDCSISKVANNTTGGNKNHNGRWQTIAVPIPKSYTCDDLEPTECWVRLEYDYGDGNQPSDTTSWAASIEGDPVRLIE